MKLPQFLMLIPFLKKLMVETSAEAFHKACKLLDQNGIKYRIQTFRFQGAIGTGLQSRSYMGFNVSQNKWGATTSLSYAIYVRHKDYETARQLTDSIKLG
jgi:hypothetical protein